MKFGTAGAVPAERSFLSFGTRYESNAKLLDRLKTSTSTIRVDGPRPWFSSSLIGCLFYNVPWPNDCGSMNDRLAILVAVVCVAVNADSCAEWCRTLDADNSDSIDIEEAYDGRVGQALIAYIYAEGVVSCSDLCETGASRLNFSIDVV